MNQSPDRLASWINEIMGVNRGKQKHPREQVKYAVDLYEFLVEKLQLTPVGPGRRDRGALIWAILQNVFDVYNVIGYQEYRQVAAAGELLLLQARQGAGFETVSDDVLAEDVRLHGMKWPSKEQWQIGRDQSKPMRLYAAMMADGDDRKSPRLVQPRQAERWAPAMADALRDYLKRSECVQEAQHLAIGLGFELADDLLQSKSKLGRPGSAESPAESAVSVIPHYIKRPLVESEFWSAVADGTKLIAIFGQPGVGKSSLAQALTVGSPFIEFNNGAPRLAQLRPQLRKYGLPADDLTEANAGGRLVDLMMVSPGPPFVVLDNLQATSELNDLVPPDSTTTVVATCREIGAPAPRACRNLPLTVMEEDEALALAHSKLPSLTEGDAQLLVSTLGNYPLVVSSACGRIASTGIAMTALCRALSIDAGSIRTTAHEQLRTIMQDDIETLRSRDLIAVDILACCSACDDLRVEVTELLMMVEVLYGDATASSKLAHALAELERFSVVEIRKDLGRAGLYPDISTYTSIGRIERYIFEDVTAAYIHPLTKVILEPILTLETAELSSKLQRFEKQWFADFHTIEDLDKEDVSLRASVDRMIAISHLRSKMMKRKSQ